MVLSPNSAEIGLDLLIPPPRAQPRRKKPPQQQVPRPHNVSAPWEKNEKLGKVVYLTFDDGPHPVYTPQILRLLAKFDASATFFMVGQARRAYPRLVEQVAAAGHRIGNHSDTHTAMTSLTDAGVQHELRLGGASKCFRPPYGATNARVEKVVEAAGMRTVLWTVDPVDWKRRAASVTARSVLSAAVPGSIILLHDGGGPRERTVAATAKILAELSAKGYHFHALPC
ncbi:MAG TPA: polysaccharide deacetylase family protein [Actinopolymorphaceae bacterium]